MKYQDFSSDENLISSEDKTFILHMWRYRGCHGYFSLSQYENTITASRPRCLYNEQNITCLLVDTNFIFSCSTLYLTRVEHSKIKFVSTRGQVISSINKILINSDLVKQKQIYNSVKNSTFRRYRNAIIKTI